MSVMASRWWYLTVLVVLLPVGCWMSVPQDQVYGRYVATYPFGTETLTLQRDGTYEQEFVIGGQPPVTTHGTWSFDAEERSRVTLREYTNVDAGFGELNTNWQTDKPEMASLSIVLEWFKIVMRSGGDYPYVKESKEERQNTTRTTGPDITRRVIRDSLAKIK